MQEETRAITDRMNKRHEDEKKAKIEKERQAIEAERKIINDKRILKEQKQNIEPFIQKHTPTKYLNVSECTDIKLLDCTHAILFGKVGTGKTYEAFSCAHTLMRSCRIKDFELCSETSILNYIKNNNGHDKYLKPDFLIIDEYMKNNQSDYSKSQIYDLLNDRYMWEKKTIVICNLTTKEAIKEAFTDAMLDRYKEYSRFFDGKSRRVL